MEAITNILSLSCYEGLVFGLLTVGVYLTFRVLCFPDLGVDGTFPLGGAVGAVLIVNGVNPILSTVGAFAAGAVAGLITGILNTKLRISALLAGILMMVGLYSVNLRIMSGSNIPLLREETSFDLAGKILGVRGMSLSIMVAGTVALVFFFVLNSK